MTAPLPVRRSHAPDHERICSKFPNRPHGAIHYRSMRSSYLAPSLLLSVLLAGQPAWAEPIELKNDGFVTGMTAGFQAGFVAGEIGAVKLVPPAGGPYQLTTVTLLFGGAATTQDVTLHIYMDGAGADPGAEIYQGDYTLTGSDQAFSNIDLTAANVYVNGAFRVGIEFQHDGAPSIARDDDGTIDAARNFILAQGAGWVESELLGLTGDWVIRATVDSNQTLPDAGVPDGSIIDAPIDAPPGPDAGNGAMCQVHSECPTGQYCDVDNTCTYDCRVDYDCGNDMRCTSLGMCEPKDGGCGCKVGGAGSGSTWLGGLFLGLAALCIVRRRKQR